MGGNPRYIYISFIYHHFFFSPDHTQSAARPWVSAPSVPCPSLQSWLRSTRRRGTHSSRRRTTSTPGRHTQGQLQGIPHENSIFLCRLFSLCGKNFFFLLLCLHNSIFSMQKNLIFSVTIFTHVLFRAIFVYPTNYEDPASNTDLAVLFANR